MEIYRTIHGPFPDCASYGPLLAIYRTALPALPVTEELEDVSVDDLRERDSKMFFPRTLICNILEENVVQQVLDCTCLRCNNRREKNSSEFVILVRYVSKRARILLAILIYLGHASWISLFKNGGYGDDNLDGFLIYISNHPPPGLLPGFAKTFQSALDLFRPPIFTMGTPKFNYGEHQRFPYINDELCGEGSSGIVRRFEIHDDYLDESLRKVATKYTLSEKGSCVFARKVLKYSMSDKDFEMEQQVLRIIDEQQHPNIIDLIAFYSWRGELNCVFPFVKLTLAEVLHSDWKPASLAQSGNFPKHWLWLQMVEVADALNTIHHPAKVSHSERGSLAGFHFDLKPKNILVTPEGVLKITDFGQSTIERVREYDYDSEDNIRGDPIYGPPETCPSRTEIQQLRSSIAPEQLTISSPQPSGPVPLRYPITSRNMSWVASHIRQRSDDLQSPISSRSITNQTLASRSHTVASLETQSTAPSFDSRPESSSLSITASSEPYEHTRLTVIANYDVWSLACIYTEVLVFILKGGSSTIKNFEDLRRLEKRDLCFHNGNYGDNSLKSCVRDTLEELRYSDKPEAATTLGYPRSYLFEIIDLVYEMFHGDPRMRLSSEQVVEKLEVLKDKHAEDNEPQPNIVKYMKSLGPPEAFRELGYTKNGIVVSFYTMTGIKYEIDVNSLVDCRLQVFRKDGAFYIRICYGEPFIDRSHLFATKDSFYCPLYVFDIQKRLICCLKDGHVRRTLHFADGEDLMIFQTVIMRHQAIRGIRVSDVSLEPKSKPDEKYENLFDANNLWPRCQIWIARDPQYVTVHSSPSTGNRSSPRKDSRTVFFFSLKGFFGVPLQDGPKLIKEERGPRESIRQKPTKVSIAGPDKWVRHFYFVKPDSGTVYAPYGLPVAPAIPLSSKWLKQDESKKATRLDVRFPQYEDLVKLRVQTMEANRNSRHTTNNIKWEEARTVPSGHGQRS